MSKRWSTLSVVLVLLAAMLSGCSFKNATLDAQMKNALVSLNDCDLDAMYQQMYPGLYEQQAFEEGFNVLMELWQPKQMDDLKLVRFNVNSKVQDGFKQKTYEGFYKMMLNDEQHYIYLAYVETSEASGIVELKLLLASEMSGIEVSAATLVTLAFDVIYCAMLAVTIIDIIRKKPRRYGWFILLSLFQVNFRVNSLAIVIPVGSLVYWGIRKKLLRKKAEWLAAQQILEEAGEGIPTDSKDAQ